MQRLNTSQTYFNIHPTRKQFERNYRGEATTEERENNINNFAILSSYSLQGELLRAPAALEINLFFNLAFIQTGNWYLPPQGRSVKCGRSGVIWAVGNNNCIETEDCDDEVRQVKSKETTHDMRVNNKCTIEEGRAE